LRARVFNLGDMHSADYRQFLRNPAVAGGMRGTAEEIMAFSQMIIDRGWYAGNRVLSDEAIDILFTNYTRDLPVVFSPFPEEHPGYPYGVDPDYGFGAWVLAEDQQTGSNPPATGDGHPPNSGNLNNTPGQPASRTAGDGDGDGDTDLADFSLLQFFYRLTGC
jgi:CubicO group peptidase (beta-lactamase class C family)